MQAATDHERKCVDDVSRAEKMYNQKNQIHMARNAEVLRLKVEHEARFAEEVETQRQMELLQMHLTQDRGSLEQLQAVEKSPLHLKEVDNIAETRYTRAVQVEEGKHSVTLKEERLSHLSKDLRHVRELQIAAQGKVALAKADCEDSQSALDEASAHMFSRSDTLGKATEHLLDCRRCMVATKKKRAAFETQLLAQVEPHTPQLPLPNSPTPPLPPAETPSVRWTCSSGLLTTRPAPGSSHFFFNECIDQYKKPTL